MGIVIVYGAQASGKTRRAKELLRHYGCTRLVDDWDGKSPLANGDLALTSKTHFNSSGAKVVPIEKAKIEILGG